MVISIGGIVTGERGQIAGREKRQYKGLKSKRSLKVCTNFGRFSTLLELVGTLYWVFDKSLIDNEQKWNETIHEPINCNENIPC